MEELKKLADDRIEGVSGGEYRVSEPVDANGNRYCGVCNGYTSQISLGQQVYHDELDTLTADMYLCRACRHYNYWKNNWLIVCKKSDF